MSDSAIDIAQLGTDILGAVQGVIEDDLPQFRNFVRLQLEGLAEQAALVAKGLAAGWIDTEDERKHWADTLRHMTREFLRTIRALVVITVERALNAIIEVFQRLFERTAGTLIPF